MNIKKTGLALSGGGQRAAAFHLGVLNMLNEHEILENIKTISSISGGSIIAAYYLLYKGNFSDFFDDFKEKLKVNLELRILFARDFVWKLALLFLLVATIVYFFCTSQNYIFLQLTILLGIILRFFLVIFPTGKSLQKVYDKVMYKGKLLTELSEKPKLIINSTNLQTGTLMTFSRSKIFDATYIMRYKYIPDIIPQKVPVSFAVTASTSFAPLISPVKFRKDQINEYDDMINLTINPELADGGIYDNQGIYKLLEENPHFVICSDASSPYDRDKYTTINPFNLLMRTINILMKRIRSFQYADALYDNHGDHEIAYFSIDWNYKDCIEHFAKNALEKKISDAILKAHDLPPEYVVYKGKEEKEIQAKKITDYMIERIKFEDIIRKSLNNEDIAKIAKISTRLRGLKDEEINNLINHGETLTIIQLKLYCPGLFVSSNNS